MSNVENVCPQVLRGVVREVRRLAADPPAGVKLLLRDNDLTDVVALIDGPADTPYAGGVFRVRLALGREFPASPPRAYFLTKIFHPNVSAAGEVCVNTLKRDWRPELGLGHALLAVRCLLIAPNADSALNAEAAALLRDRYDDYFARAKLYTDIHARPDHAHSAHAHKQEYRDVEENVEEGGEAGGESAESGEGAPRPKRERRAAGARDTRRILKRL
ncbi:PREDICTED: ubiquitin-conjugating enzyme E2 S-like isoform X3 [Papilio xuthus]|uniref:E2 ubiquitin-conjugating enzyme n=1 Tax=Papilio xuthus TaxID=66420 RepID=A0AAJ7EKD5_PAPXU|nr:PREDICTED: ubiquitin-conjugating enzyme E2 S-like isoform X3 [Papilio xuthus]